MRREKWKVSQSDTNTEVETSQSDTTAEVKVSQSDTNIEIKCSTCGKIIRDDEPRYLVWEDGEVFCLNCYIRRLLEG